MDPPFAVWMALTWKSHQAARLQRLPPVPCHLALMRTLLSVLPLLPLPVLPVWKDPATWSRKTSQRLASWPNVCHVCFHFHLLYIGTDFAQMIDLAAGYHMSDLLIERAIDMDRKYSTCLAFGTQGADHVQYVFSTGKQGISARFMAYINQLDNKVGETGKSSIGVYRDGN
jgi:hypothetical protein